MNRELTEQQKRILKFVKSFIKREGFPPTQSQIAEKFGFKSLTAARDHLKAIEAKGYVEITPHVARGIKVL